MNLDLTGYTLLQRYHLRERIGQGAMSDVYRAWDQKLQIDVAVKVLAAHLARDFKAKHRFEQEAQKAARLDHENIIRVTNIGEDQGWNFMVMKLIHGETLASRLDAYRERGERMPHDEIVAIAEQIARALDFAHDQGIFHRDVKPANVMIDGDGRVTLLDFGLVKAMDETAHLTSDGSKMGTAMYMNPEQAAGSCKENEDPDILRRGDVYSLGCVIHEMLIGRPPFQGNPMTVITKHMSEKAIPLREVDPSIAPEVSQVVHRALEKNWADRWPSAGAFVKALKGSFGSAPPPPPPQIQRGSHPQPEAEPPGPDKPRGPILAVLAAALLLVAGVLGLMQLDDSIGRRDEHEAATATARAVAGQTATRAAEETEDAQMPTVRATKTPRVPTRTSVPTKTSVPTSTTAPPTEAPTSVPPPKTSTPAPPTSPPPTTVSEALRWWVDGPALNCDTTCTKIRWEASGFEYVHFFSEGTAPGDRKPVNGSEDNWCWLAPGQESRLILRGVRSNGTTQDYVATLKRDGCD